MKKDNKKVKGKVGRPRRKDKSIAEFVGEIEKDRLTEQEQEIFFNHIDHAEIEKYVRTYLPTSSEEDVDSFSYWFGQG